MGPWPDDRQPTQLTVILSGAHTDPLGEATLEYLKYLVAYATLFDLLFSQADIDTSTFYVQ